MSQIVVRTYISIVEAFSNNTIIKESSHTFVEVFGNSVQVWKNPNHELFFKLLEKFRKMRGTIDDNGDAYVWDAAVAIHSSIEQGLSINPIHQLMLTSGDITLEYDVDENEIRNIPSIERMYKNAHFEIYNDSEIDDEDEDDDDYY